MNAPEQCPVCGSGIYNTWPGEKVERMYSCNADWYDGRWVKSCSHAMTACLRTGATLTATPLEQAEKALVAAGVAYGNAYQLWVSGQPYIETVNLAQAGLQDAALKLCALLDGAK